jgi:hypothetical protein
MVFSGMTTDSSRWPWRSAPERLGKVRPFHNMKFSQSSQTGMEAAIPTGAVTDEEADTSPTVEGWSSLDVIALEEAD